jgi:hypothetical protein
MMRAASRGAHLSGGELERCATAVVQTHSGGDALSDCAPTCSLASSCRQKFLIDSAHVDTIELVCRSLQPIQDGIAGRVNFRVRIMRHKLPCQ